MNSAANTDQELEKLIELLHNMDTLAYSDRFGEALALFDRNSHELEPIREKVLARSINKDIGKRMYEPYEDGVNGFFG